MGSSLVRKAADPKGWELIQDQTLVSIASVMDFPSLDINSDGEYILRCWMISNGAGDNAIQLVVNADTTMANYTTQESGFDGGSVVAGSNNGSFICTVEVGKECAVDISIKRVNGYFLAIALVSRNGGTTQQSALRTISTDGTIANITALQLACINANAFAAGCRTKLYKVI